MSRVAVVAAGPLRAHRHLAKTGKKEPVSLINFVIMAVVGMLAIARSAGAIIILRRRGRRFLAPSDARLIAELGAMLLFAGIVCISVPGLVNPASVNSDSVDGPGWAGIADLWASGTLVVAGITIIGLSGWVQVRNRGSVPEGRHVHKKSGS